MKPLPNLRQLRYLVSLAEHLHFGRAADACAVTQSTLSAGIRELEAILGVTVAERTKRSVLITPIGRRIVERAHALLRDAEALVSIGASATRPLTGQLELGVIPTIGPFLLPELLPHIGRHYPDLKLILREDKTNAILDRLGDGRLDLGLIAFPYVTEGFEALPLFDDPYWFACHRRHRLAAMPSIGEADLADEGLMLLERDHCLHSHALPLLAALPKLAQTTFSATSLHTLVAMVAADLGATLLPELAIRAGILHGDSVAICPLADGAHARRIGLVWRKQSVRADEFRILGDLISDWAATALSPPERRRSGERGAEISRPRSARSSRGVGHKKVTRKTSPVFSQS
ncbi:hydrogen peroxide-inducible genes activator [Rhodoplanes sp. TEM]|uniref:Hydrogen peroxide-inducible genes activator n=1 Tax=Rhodoplanes tepidamans TaxID=200616 RepID=A0ABT5J806_RHOTP|nr:MULTISPECIES: hydrogen peroxide-inducible genes activator [Rhodoplanes]MDC7785785.1 hydrogen peroxide-inducible genes activator [Rhodoplanes tepidamans]MDC7984052.1 hydrogen peroxide-inducible genes activator [Rhodoplanes sp. TEM]MDQ0354652.1 LysR family hydrogen peroxide-inducible transcriptional activator [Rhodoplanes tepidamans]